MTARRRALRSVSSGPTSECRSAPGAEDQSWAGTWSGLVSPEYRTPTPTTPPGTPRTNTDERRLACIQTAWHPIHESWSARTCSSACQAWMTMPGLVPRSYWEGLDVLERPAATSYPGRLTNRQRRQEYGPLRPKNTMGRGEWMMDGALLAGSSDVLIGTSRSRRFAFPSRP